MFYFLNKNHFFFKLNCSKCYLMFSFKITGILLNTNKEKKYFVLTSYRYFLKTAIICEKRLTLQAKYFYDAYLLILYQNLSTDVTQFFFSFKL